MPAPDPALGTIEIDVVGRPRLRIVGALGAADPGPVAMIPVPASTRVAVGRKNYLFVGSLTGGRAAAIAYTLIETAKLNGVDPKSWLADTLARIPDYKITRVNELLPWNRAK